jgi:RNA polymerase sigma-70 factor (ECF subfamily)
MKGVGHVDDVRAMDELREFGRSDAVANLFRSQHRRLVGLAALLVDDRAAAEDVVQDVFAHLWRRPTFDDRRGSLRSYITMLARSRAIDRWRSQAVQESLVDRLGPDASTHEPSASERVIERERRAEVVALVDRLPPVQREAIVLAFGAGLTSGEIAAAVGVPHGTAKSRVRLGLAKLRVAA